MSRFIRLFLALSNLSSDDSDFLFDCLEDFLPVDDGCLLFLFSSLGLPNYQVI
jgi:hypothetical protein